MHIIMSCLGRPFEEIGNEESLLIFDANLQKKPAVAASRGLKEIFKENYKELSPPDEKKS